MEQSERTFQMIPRLAILAGEPASCPRGAMGDAGDGRIGSHLGVTPGYFGTARETSNGGFGSKAVGRRSLMTGPYRVKAQF